MGAGTWEVRSVWALGVYLVPYLVNGVAYGQQVSTKPLEFPPILLHQGYKESASLLTLILLCQGQLYLWIGPKGICHVKEVSRLLSLP